jgi:hypothetical protein
LGDAPAVEAGCQVGVGDGQDGGGQEGGVGGASVPNGECSDRDAGGHLHNREQAVHTLEAMGLNGNAEDWKRGPGGAHPGKVRGATGAGDDDPEATRAGGDGVIAQPVGSAVGGDDAGLVRDYKLDESRGRVAQGGPVGLAAHDDADEGRGVHLGDVVRDQTAFQPGDLVLQHQLALLETLELELIDRPLLCQPGDNCVQVTMLAAQFVQTAEQ